MRGNYKKEIKYISFLILIIILLCFIILQNKQQELPYISGYGLDDKYKTLKYYSNIRSILLKVGLSDKGGALSWLEEKQKYIYKSAIVKIPENSPERINWDYAFHIYPYANTSKENGEIKDNLEKIKQAVKIINKYPEIDNYDIKVKQEILERLSLKNNAFEHIVGSLNFALYNYPLKDSISAPDLANLISTAWAGYVVYTARYSLEKNRDSFREFPIKLLNSANEIISYSWEDARLNCQHNLLLTRQGLKQNIFAIIDVSYGQKPTLDKKDITKNLYNGGQNDFVAEEKIKQQCKKL